MTKPLLPTTPVFVVTLDQVRSFVDLMVDYFRRVDAGEMPPVPAELMMLASASMQSQLVVDDGFNRGPLSRVRR